AGQYPVRQPSSKVGSIRTPPSAIRRYAGCGVDCPSVAAVSRGRRLRGEQMSCIRAGKYVAWLIVLGACASVVAPTADARRLPRLVVAVEGPQSGEQAPNGLDQLRGVRLAVRQLDARGGLWDGRRVVVEAADDK